MKHKLDTKWIIISILTILSLLLCGCIKEDEEGVKYLTKTGIVKDIIQNEQIHVVILFDDDSVLTINHCEDYTLSETYLIIKNYKGCFITICYHTYISRRDKTYRVFDEVVV